MSRRQRARRRLIWAGVMFGLLLLIASIFMLRAGLWARDEAGRLAQVRRPRRSSRRAVSRLQPKGRHA